MFIKSTNKNVRKMFRMIFKENSEITNKNQYINKKTAFPR